MPERPGDMDERDVDARFASIVAGWEGPLPDAVDATSDVDAAADAGGSPSASPAGLSAPADGSPSDDAARPPEPDEQPPSGPHVGADADPEGAEKLGEPPAPPSPWVTPAPLDVVVPPSAWRAAEVEPEEDHFQPPEVVLPPQEDLHFWGAVIGLVTGPLMLLYVVFARPFHSTRWFIAAVVVSLVGFALLVLRQPSHRDPTSDDDGARV